ncbi:MAG TPA: universal stress protein [Actinomycetota bacterium]|nr:universal stress protein [Actinomycetota bacterium]
MFERILLAVDGSEHSRRAVPVAAELAYRHGGEILVFHVREHEVALGVDVDAETPQEAMDLVDGIVRELKDLGVGVRGEIVRVPLGQTTRAILNATEDEEMDLIVLGTRGLSDWSRLLVGSVAHKVVHLAHVPVLVVR